MIEIKYNIAKIYGFLIFFLSGILFSTFLLSDYRYIDYGDLNEVKILDVVNFKECDYCIYEIGIVTQVKGDNFLILYEEYGETKFYDFSKNNIAEYQIVGKGTVYHKINIYFGFDIMFYNKILIIVLIIILHIKWLGELTV